MSKKAPVDTSNPFQAIDKSRFAKAPEAGGREESYKANKFLSRGKKLKTPEENVPDDYFASVMSMGGVSRLAESPKLNVAEQKMREASGVSGAREQTDNARPDATPGAVFNQEEELFEEWTEDLTGELADELRGGTSEDYFAENLASSGNAATLEDKSGHAYKQAENAKKTRHEGPEAGKNLDAKAPAGTMSSLLSTVIIAKNSDRNLPQNTPQNTKDKELGADKQREEDLLRDYLAAASKKSNRSPVSTASERASAQPQNNQRGSATPANSDISGVYTTKSPSGSQQIKVLLEPESDEQAFASAMGQVAPLSARGREVAPTPPLRPATPIIATNPLQDFIDGKVEFSLEFTDEYIEGHVLGLDPAVVAKMRAGSFSYEAHLDLHGLNASQAFDGLVAFIRSSYQNGKRSVLLIPGRGKNSPDGTGILRDKLQEWLTEDPFKRVVLAFCTALPKHGGPGALYVLLRKLKKSRGKIRWDYRPNDPDLYRTI